MTTTAAAENKAGHPEGKEKEKVEKRRALGRGLASLFGGPRVVTGGRPAGAPAVGHGEGTATAELRSAGQLTSAAFAKNAKDGAPKC